MSCSGLHQVVQEGESSSLPHQVLPLRPAAGRARRRAGGPEVGRRLKFLEQELYRKFAKGKVVFNTDCGCRRRKRSSSKGSDFMSDRKNEDQNSTCHRDDRERSAAGTGRTAMLVRSLGMSREQILRRQVDANILKICRYFYIAVYDKKSMSRYRIFFCKFNENSNIHNYWNFQQ